MGIVQAFKGAFTGTLSDQWKEVIVPGAFDEFSAVVPGLLQIAGGAGAVNYSGSLGVISNGSKFFVPENTAAFIYSQDRIEGVITEAGGYEYQTGQASVLNGDGLKESIVDQFVTRFGYGGQAVDRANIAFVNLREIRGIKFGTRGPLIYNDHFYGADLEITAFGSFSLRIVDPMTFLRNFVPPNTSSYNFQSPQPRQQLMGEFLQSFTASLNSLSSRFRISQLPSQANVVAAHITCGGEGAPNWVERFGIDIVNVGIEAIEFTPSSWSLVNQYNQNLMSLKAYENINQHASNVAAQQKVADGIQSHGFGDAGGMFLGMNMAQGVSTSMGTPLPSGQAQNNVAPDASGASRSDWSLNEQIEAVQKLKELFDAGILTEDEFNLKKKQVMGI